MSTSLQALQFFAESVQSVFDDVQLVPDVLHHAVDVVGVLQNVHALSVGVVAYREGTSKGLGKLPADTAHTLHPPQLQLSHRLRTKIRDKQGQGSRCVSHIMWGKLAAHLILFLASSKLSAT